MANAQSLVEAALKGSRDGEKDREASGGDLLDLVLAGATCGMSEVFKNDFPNYQPPSDPQAKAVYDEAYYRALSNK